MSNTSGGVQNEVYGRIVRSLNNCRAEGQPFNIMLAGFAAPHTPETVFHGVKELLTQWVYDMNRINVDYRLLAVDCAEAVHQPLLQGSLAPRLEELRRDKIVDIVPVCKDLTDSSLLEVAKNVHLTWVDCLLSCADDPEGVTAAIRQVLDANGIVLLRDLLVRGNMSNLWLPPATSKIDDLPYTFLSKLYFKKVVEDSGFEARQLPLSAPNMSLRGLDLTETAWILFPEEQGAAI